MDERVSGGRGKLRLRSFSKALPITLLQAREAVMQRFRPALRLFGVTEQQWRVLRALSSVESIEVTELAEATCLLAPSLSRILKDLEDRDFVVKRPVPEDLRRAQVSITENGLALIDLMAPFSESIYAEISDVYGAEKMESLQKLLRELVEGLKDLPPPDVDLEAHGIDVSRFAPGQARGRPRTRG